jgi:hypothetical protein
MKKLIISIFGIFILLNSLFNISFSYAQVATGKFLMVMSQPLAHLISTPSSWDYGTVTILTTATKAFTITNNGNNSTTLGATPESYTGTNAAYFTTSASTCGNATLIPSGTCSITVKYAPILVGAHSATLNIAYQDYGTHSAPNLTVAVSGTGAGSPP